jgi:hypothetical protein
LFLALLLAFNGRKVVFIRVPLYQSFVLLLLFCVAYDSGSSVVLYTAALGEFEYDFCIFFAGTPMGEMGWSRSDETMGEKKRVTVFHARLKPKL